MERRLNTVLFLPWIPWPKLGSGVDPGASAFDVVAIWGQIEAARAKAPLNITPPGGRHAVLPSDAAKRARANASRPALLGVAVISAAAGGFLAAAGGFLAVPLGFVPWVFLALVGYLLARPKPLDAKEFKDRYENSERHYLLALEDWNRRCGVRELEATYQKLHATRQAYDKAVSDETAAVAKLNSERREQQLRDHLARFSLVRMKLKGIGPSTRALLASYGLDTAADMQEARLLAVPGIGPVVTKPTRTRSLSSGRDRCEQN
jgi:hypothetical protein